MRKCTIVSFFIFSFPNIVLCVTDVERCIDAELLKIDDEIEVAKELVKNEKARKKIAEEITFAISSKKNNNLEKIEIDKVFRQWGTSTMVFIEVGKREKGEINQLKQIRSRRSSLAKEMCMMN
mgnify:CR=1 FL=1